MPKLETLSHTFQHAWPTISFASWLKYPSPARPDVVCVDLLRRDFDTETGELRTTRLVTIKPSIPGWIQAVIGTSYCYFVEEAIIDPKNNKMVLKAKNISFGQFLEMQETCTYTQHSENKDWTQFSQEGKVTSFSTGLGRMVEDFCLKTFKTNATKGRELMENAVFNVQTWKAETERTLENFSKGFEEFGNRLKTETEELVHQGIEVVQTQKERVGLLNALPE